MYFVITTYREAYHYACPPASSSKFTKLARAIRYAEEESKWESAAMVIVTTSGGTIEMTLPGEFA